MHSVAFTPPRKKEHPQNVWFFPTFSTHILMKLSFTRLVALHRFSPILSELLETLHNPLLRTTSFSFPFQVANLNGKLTATQTTLTTSDQDLRQKETEVGNVFETRKAVLTVGSLTAREITYSNFDISLVVFMPNINTNHAITYTYTTT